MSALEKVLAKKTDAQLMYYIENIDKHTEEAVKLAIKELQSRDVVLSEVVFKNLEMHQKARLRKNISFPRRTLLFCFIGLFISYPTLLGIWGFQSVISLLTGCVNSWMIVWVITGLGAIILPVLFLRHIREIDSKRLQSLGVVLAFFNLIEYILIQCSLAMFYVDGKMLCYGHDGLMILPFVLSSWVAIFLLIIFSLVCSIFAKLPEVE
jgi:hypothetical protein